VLREYRIGDLDLQLRLLGDPDTMRHLGGPESREQIERRHERSLRMTDPADGLMLVIEDEDGVAMGTIGYWTRGWRDEQVWESGWFVLPEHRGRGVARSGLHELVALLRSRPERRALHAFPSVDNAPSNDLCSGAGFVLLEEVDFEYPKGHRMRCNDWRLDPTA
jgi:RimJ/RimL family protein N-acetyltransferase